MVIDLNPAWASSLAYDFLDRPGDPKPIFVGRQYLLDPLIADIMNAQKSGAYLISGYRGAGKTSLLIEALWQAQRRGIENGSVAKLFVVVLNVSEVSASLEFGIERTSEPITIDPRRLLIALLRSLTNRVRSFEANGNTLAAQLKTRISETYDKAIAAAYTQASSTRREQEENRASKSSWEVSATAPYKVGGTLAALAAIGIEALTWASLRPILGHLFAGAAAIAATWSWSKSWSLSKSLRDTSSSETTLRFDNSLQQLENDLKDILLLLSKEGIRTIVVLEELDKIDDAGGAQLDKVIRYFKNLFTQAPALFFFLADKAYFDLVESRIRRARSRRYYALEHTFFTHRLYVGRPNLQDSLDYIREAATDDRYKALVASLSARAQAAEPADGDERFGRFVRVLLFRSANHLFDLKNELRRYVRNVSSAGGVALVVDDQSFPDDEAALSVFQNLVESKTRAYAFARERTYANEALQDYLYGVFQEIGSTRRQQVWSFYPRGSQEIEVAAESGASAHTTSVESALEWDEIQRVVDAVDSLVTDLFRGGAFESLDKNGFVWKRNPARTFHLERQLERHEIELLGEMRRLMAEVESIEPEGAIGRWVPWVGYLRTDLRAKERAIQAALTSITVEEANAEKENWRSRVEHLLAEIYRTYLDRVKSDYGFSFNSVQYGPGGEAVHQLLLQRPPPDPAAADIAIFVVLGQLQAFGMAPTSISPALKRASVIEVVRHPPDVPQTPMEAWNVLQPPAPRASENDEQAPGPPNSADLTVSLDIIALDEGLSPTSPGDAWGQLLGDTILFRLYWATCWAPPMKDVPQVREGQLGDSGKTKRRNFLDAVAAWAQGEGRTEAELGGVGRLLWIETPAPRTADSTVSALEVQRSVALIKAGFGQARFQDVAAADQILLAHPDGIWSAVSALTPLGGAFGSGSAATERLLQQGRLICLSVAQQDDSEGRVARELRETIGTRGRAIYVGESLPEELRRLGVTHVELP